MKMNSRRLTRAIMIGLVGVLVLSVSAFAAWGSSTGYGKYKDAVTKIFVDTDNVTIDAEAAILFDGETAHEDEMLWKIDGSDYSKYEKSSSVVKTDAPESEYYYSAIGNTETYFYSEEPEHYYQYERDMAYADNPLSLGAENEKVIRFVKLCADSIIGDLKNNVVLVDDKNGIRSYRLDVTADQMPAVISAGFDLLMSVNNQGSGYVVYEGESNDLTYAVYYEKIKGTPLPEDYFDVLYNDGDDAMWEEYDDICMERDAYYEEIRAKSGESAVLSVKDDGSYDVYANYRTYAFTENYGSSDIEAYLGSNAVLYGVTFDFALDDNDRLVSNDLSVLFSVVDDNGEKHTVELKLNVDFSDYGTTVPDVFDVGDRTLTNG